MWEAKRDTETKQASFVVCAAAGRMAGCKQVTKPSAAQNQRQTELNADISMENLHVEEITKLQENIFCRRPEREVRTKI